jgi:NagD protein
MHDEAVFNESATTLAISQTMPDLAQIRHVVLDLDGTIYLGKTLFPQTRPFLDALGRLGIGHSFVTNNCTRSRAEYAAHLREMGIDASPESIWTSAHATIYHLRKKLPLAKKLFVLGTSGLDDEFRQCGFAVVDDRPDSVVVSFDTSLTYDRLCQTAYWISQGLPYVATHPDRVCPTDRPTVLPDCGAICALLESATGRRPDAVPGKPDPAMLRAVMGPLRLSPREVAMVGDRVYTDIRMARDAGVIAILTLTGETKRTQIESSPPDPRPDFVVSDLGELVRMIEEARDTGRASGTLP